MRTPLLIAALFCLPLTSLAQDSNPASLQARMNPADFHAAGLDRLSPAELASLDAWLAAHPNTVTRTRMVTPEGKPVFYADKQKRTTVEAHVAGAFNGWGGHTVIDLDNGQRWRQVGSDQPACASSENPTAKVKPSLFGSWLMYVKGCNGNVHVERVK